MRPIKNCRMTLWSCLIRRIPCRKNSPTPAKRSAHSFWPVEANDHRKGVFYRIPVISAIHHHYKEARDIGLTLAAKDIQNATIAGKKTPVMWHSDTTDCNADVIEENKDTSKEDLVKKMPGVAIGSGMVTAKVEQVWQVLVDGKPLFGDDPTLALRHLPAEAADNIQVYHWMLTSVNSRVLTTDSDHISWISSPGTKDETDNSASRSLDMEMKAVILLPVCWIFSTVNGVLPCFDFPKM